MSTEIESLELKIKSNSTSAVSGIDALTESLEKLRKATKGLGLSSVATDIGKVASATDKASRSNEKAAKSFTDLYLKLKTVASTFKMVGKAIYSSIEKSSDYVENVNLFTVSMGEFASEAKGYAETIGEIMGIDPGEWMRNQGIFMTLATGFGVAGDRAALMSKNLTQLGYDLSSFYNISVEEAVQKIKSGFAGELEPLRAVGYDLSQAKLEATALSLGIDKAVSSMTQAEKAQLRYYAIMTQVTTVQGDMARTLESPANQMRVFKAQVSMAAREIGNVFIPALNAILPYAIAVTKVVRILASTIASLFGYEMPDMSESTGNVVTNTDAMKENLEGAEKEAKKLKSYMLGIDELNVINPNEGNSSSGIDDALGGFDFELPDYTDKFLEGLTESKVALIVEDMKEWLGITDDIDSWSDLFKTRLGEILNLVGLIGIGMLAWKVTKETIDAIAIIKSILSNPSYAIAIGVVLTITGVVMAFGAMGDAIKEGLDGINFAEIIGGSLLATGGAALLGSKIATWIATAFTSSAVDLVITKAGINLGVGTVGAAGTALGAGFAAIILGIPMYFTGIYDACVNGIKWLSAALIGLGATLAGAGIGTIIGACGGPIGAGVGALIGLAIGLITDFTILIWQHLDDIVAWFLDLPAIAKVAIGYVGVTLGLMLWPLTVIVGVIVGIVVAIKQLIYVIENFPAILDKVVTALRDLPKNIALAFESAGEWVMNLPTMVKEKLDEMRAELDALPEKIGNWFSGIQENIKKWFADLWQPIKDYDWTNLGRDIGAWFGEAMKSAFIFVTQTLPQWQHELGESIKKGFYEYFFVILPTFWTETLPQVIWDIAVFFFELPGKIQEVMGSVKQGLIDVGVAIVLGIFEGLATVWDAITEFCTGFIDGFKEGWGIHSPSTVFQEIGVFLIEGLLNGISETWVKIDTFISTAHDNLLTSFSTAWGKIKTTVTTIFDEMWKYVKTPMNAIIGGVEKMTNGVINGFNSMIRALNRLSFSVPDWVPEIGGKSFGFNLSTISTISIPRLAEGGFPAEGQMFIAREAGPEMVGSIGRRTAVANNDQIISGIAGGVATANEEQNVLLREQNSLLRAILEKDSGVYLDGKNLTNSVEKYQRERGRVLIAGGVL